MSYKAAVLAKAGSAPKPMQFKPVGFVLSDSASSSKQQEKQVAFADNTTDNEGKSSRNRSERKSKLASKDNDNKVPLVSETFAPMSDKSSDKVVNLVDAAKKSLYSGGIDTMTETESLESQDYLGESSASSKAPKIVESDKDITKRSFQALNELAEALCSAKEQVVVLVRSKPFNDSADLAKVMVDFADDIKANLNEAATVVDTEFVDEGDDLFSRMI